MLKGIFMNFLLLFEKKTKMNPLQFLSALYFFFQQSCNTFGQESKF